MTVRLGSDSIAWRRTRLTNPQLPIFVFKLGSL